MTYKTGQISVRAYACGVNIFKTLKLRDRWADVDETWHAYSIGRGTKLLGSVIVNFGLCAARTHPELSPVWRDDPPQAGRFLYM